MLISRVFLLKIRLLFRQKTAPLIMMILLPWIATLSTVAQAAPVRDLKAEFLAAGLKIPLALDGMGYKTLGRLNLSELEGLMPSVLVVAASDSQVRGANDGYRVTGHWSVVNGQKLISVVPYWWDQNPAMKPLLALHEYLGVAGFDDDNYWISTSLYCLTLAGAQELLHADEKAKIEKWVARNSDKRLDGGVVGVGGGGEESTLLARVLQIDERVAALAKVSPDQHADAFLNLADALSSTLEAWQPYAPAEYERAYGSKPAASQQAPRRRP